MQIIQRKSFPMAIGKYSNKGYKNQFGIDISADVRNIREVMCKSVDLYSKKYACVYTVYCIW